VIRSERQWRDFEFPLVSSLSLRRLRKKVKRVTLLLENKYGVPHWKRRNDLVDVLIQTILSQNTNDRNRDHAYQRLKTRFPLWENVLKASTQSIIQAIRPGGLAEQKAGRIKEILWWVKNHEGRMSLTFLKKMDSEQIKKTVGSLKGIGPKTVHCLLLFGMGREAFPVDTHVLRVGKHLGIIPVMVRAEGAHKWMAPLVPKGKSLSLHLNLIRFGREICRAKNPLCHVCFLVDECYYPHCR
jgi:endonuclease-3